MFKKPVSERFHILTDLVCRDIGKAWTVFGTNAETIVCKGFQKKDRLRQKKNPFILKGCALSF